MKNAKCIILLVGFGHFQEQLQTQVIILLKYFTEMYMTFLLEYVVVEKAGKKTPTSSSDTLHLCLASCRWQQKPWFLLAGH